MTRAEIVAALERDPLRNIVLLKHLEAFPDSTRLFRESGPRGAATMVLLDTEASPFDRQTYPETAFAALISSDCPSISKARTTSPCSE